jgi:hypothetical protein
MESVVEPEYRTTPPSVTTVIWKFTSYLPAAANVKTVPLAVNGGLKIAVDALMSGEVKTAVVKVNGSPAAIVAG